MRAIVAAALIDLLGWFRDSITRSTSVGVVMKSMLVLFGILFVSAAIVSPNTALAASANVVAKCQEKYPDSGNTQQRMTNKALQRQCIANGGK